MKYKLTLAFILATSVSAMAQTVFPYPGGWCQKGGQGVVTQGLKSSGTYTLPSGSLISGTGVQASYGSCRVTVYNAGTIVKPTIYSSSSLGVLTNPFTANADGSFIFYGTAGCYDVVTDHASMPAAHTDSICLGSGGVPGSGTVTQANPATDAGTFTPLFTFGFATQTTTPTLSFTLLPTGAHTVFGNGTGVSAFPSYFSLGTADLPFTYSGNTTKLATVSATFSGTGAPVYRDASGNLSTSGTPVGVTSWNARTGAVLPQSGDYVVADVTGAAPLASPTFTGTPAAPTAAPGTSTTQLATTAFVATSFAPLASPTFTGVPLAPTAAVDTATTQIATTAFVVNQPSHGMLISAAGIGAPVTVSETHCTTMGYSTNIYTFLADSTYAEQACLDTTTATPSPINTWVIGRRLFFKDGGNSATQGFKNAGVSINHLSGTGTVTTNQDRAVGILMENPTADSGVHFAMEAIQAELDVNGTATVTGSPDGEASAGSFQLADSHLGIADVHPTLGFNGIRSEYFREAGAGNFSSCTGAPCQNGGFFIYENLSTVAGASNAVAALHTKVVDLAGPGSSLQAYSLFVETPAANRFAANYGIFVDNFGTNAADFDLLLGGVNSAGTPAGFAAAVGPFAFGIQGHATAGWQTDTRGGARIIATATGGNMLGLFGFTSGSAQLGVADAAGTPNRINLPTATAATSGDSFISDAGSPQQASWSPRTSAYACGTTTTCSATLLSGPPKVVQGSVTLSTGTATVASLPAFTSTATFNCVASDNTSIATSASAVPASASSITVTGTGSDVVSYICVGN